MPCNSLTLNSNILSRLIVSELYLFLTTIVNKNVFSSMMLGSSEFFKTPHISIYNDKFAVLE